MEAGTTGSRTAVVDMEGADGEAEVMEESAAGEESSAVTGRTGTAAMAGRETETGPGTAGETGATVEGISPTLRAPVRATTPSTRGHNMTATKLSGFVSIYMDFINLHSRHVQPSNVVLCMMSQS